MPKFSLFVVFLLLKSSVLLALFPISFETVQSETAFTGSDSVMVNMLNNESWSLRRTDPLKAILIGQKSLNLAREIGYSEGEAKSMNYLGIFYLRLQDSQTASEYFFKTLAFSDSLKIDIEKGYALNNIASCLLFEGEYNQALDYARKSLVLQTQNHNQKGVAYSLLRMSDIFNSLQQYDSLLIAAQSSYVIFKESGMRENALVALKNIGRGWEGKEQYSKALNCYMEIANDISVPQEIVLDVYADLLRIYNLLKLPDQSIFYGKKWLDEKKGNDVTYKNMANSYALKENWKEAFHYALLSISAKDSVEKEEKFRQIKNLQILYETRQTEKENTALRSELKTQYLFVATFAFIILLIGLLVLILLSKKNQQARLNKMLNQKNAEISTQCVDLEVLNHTKDKLFSIIAHDLRGPIGNTSAFLEVLTTNEEEFTKEELLENLILLKNSSKATFKLLENLLTWALAQRGEIIFKPLQNNLFNLVKSNVDLFQSNAENKKIRVINALHSQLIFDFDYEMINTVIRNLINNAIKYTGENGEISISANIIEDAIEISVKDTGIGMDQETAQLLFLTDLNLNRKEGTNGEKGTGLGLIICREFVQKHRGKIWAISECGKGTTIKFTLPLKQSDEGLS